MKGHSCPIFSQNVLQKMEEERILREVASDIGALSDPAFICHFAGEKYMYSSLLLLFTVFFLFYMFV